MSNLDFQGWGGGCISLHDLPFFVYQELCEVPLDTISKYSSFLLFQKLVKWRCILPIDFNLRWTILGWFPYKMTHEAVFKQIFHMGWLSLIRNHLVKDREFSFEPSANNFLNFFIVSWLLSSKLVAWKCQDFKSWRWRSLGSISFTSSHNDKYSWQISFFLLFFFLT